jgi:Ca-activated chloride channel family protein
VSLSPVVPWWLWAVLAVVGLGGLALAWRRADAGSRPGALRHLGLGAVVALLALHPGVGRSDAGARATDLEVLVVLDRTTSMDALDWDGGSSRLEGVRTDLRALANDLAGSRFALITFGSRAQLELPFTTDVDAFVSAVDGVRREDSFEGQGSLVERAVPDAVAVLTRAREQHPERRRLLVFAGDGEVTEGDDGSREWARARDLVEGGLVLGYGTSAGGRMRVFGDEDDESWIYDQKRGAVALSRIDERRLRAIAGEFGGYYLHSERPGQVADVAAGIERDYSGDGGRTPARHDLSWVLGLGLLGLLVPELRESVRALRRTRREARWTS